MNKSANLVVRRVLDVQISGLSLVTLRRNRNRRRRRRGGLGKWVWRWWIWRQRGCGLDHWALIRLDFFHGFL